MFYHFSLGAPMQVQVNTWGSPVVASIPNGNPYHPCRIVLLQYSTETGIIPLYDTEGLVAQIPSASPSWFPFPEAMLSEEGETSLYCELDAGEYYVVCQAPYDDSTSPGYAYTGPLRTGIHGRFIGGITPSLPVEIVIDDTAPYWYLDQRNSMVYNGGNVYYRIETHRTADIVLETENGEILGIEGYNVSPSDSVAISSFPAGRHMIVVGFTGANMDLNIRSTGFPVPDPEPFYTETIDLVEGNRILRREYSGGDNIRLQAAAEVMLLLEVQDNHEENNFSIQDANGVTILPSAKEGTRIVYCLDAGEYHLQIAHSIHSTSLIIKTLCPSLRGTSINVNPTSALNYIITRKALQPSVSITDSDNSVTDVEYFDLLGRPLETILQSGSPFGEDLVTEYNFYTKGRKTETWESVPLQTRTGAYAGRPALATNSTEQGYEARFTEHGYTDDLLDRESSRLGPGCAWHDAGKASTKAYGVNTAGGERSCLLLTVSSLSGTLRRPTVQGICPPGRYSVIETTDEDGRKQLVFRDNQGRMVIDRRIISDGVYADTYYVYDTKGLLSVVVPPEASKSAVTSGTISSSIYTLYCYSYAYDNQGRRISCKKPGSIAAFRTVYGKSDRPIFTQTPLQASSNVWECDIPDKQGRTAVRAIVRMSSHMIPNRNDNIYAERVVGVSGILGYSFSIPLSIVKLLEVRWYDDYSFLTLFAPERVDNLVDDSILLDASIRGISGMRTTKSLMTGRMVSSMNTDEYKLSCVCYDYWGNQVVEREENILGGISETRRRFDFRGNEVLFEETHAGSSIDSQHITRHSIYDGRDRLSGEIWLSDQDTLGIINYGYDDFGRGILRRVKTSGLEDFRWSEYSERDWPTRKKDGLTENIYRYENPVGPAIPQWGGNLSQWMWKHGSDSLLTSYSYDGLSRMTGYQTQGGNGGYTFDRNGNITTVTLNGGGAVPCTYQGNWLRRVGTGFGDNEYDSIGRLTFDSTNNLSFEYNDLNQIEKVLRDSTVLGKYSYLSDGRKMSVADNVGNEFFYVGSLIYRKSGAAIVPESASWSGGRLRARPDAWGEWGWTPLLFSEDHLGSVVAIRDGETGNVTERNAYSPYGVRTKLETVLPAQNNRFLYNSKEEQTVADWPLLDYGARMYAPCLGRWLIPDPDAERTPSWSPYAFCYDNPVNFKDPDGKFPETLWDIANLVIDIKSLVQDIREDNVKDALIDGGGLLLDAAAAIVPFVPGGAGTAIKAARKAEKIVDATGAVKKTVSAKNSKAVYGPTKNRVKLWKNVRQKIIDNAEKFPNGDFVEPNGKFPVPKDGPYDIGHKKNQSWKTRKEMHEREGHTRRQVIEMENDPDLYQIEDIHLNRSHKYE